MADRTHPQNSKNALACETSTRPRYRCRCRCAGERHGLKRFSTWLGAHALEQDDPHHCASQRARPWEQLTLEDTPC